MNLRRHECRRTPGADKVLVRWQLPDGRYKVIFGDLGTETETVTADRLKRLER